LDDVSYHTTFVDMGELKEERAKERALEDTKKKLIKEVYSKDYKVVDQLEKRIAERWESMGNKEREK